jgi:hypothetical protein
MVIVENFDEKQEAVTGMTKEKIPMGRQSNLNFPKSENMLIDNSLAKSWDSKDSDKKRNLRFVKEENI